MASSLLYSVSKKCNRPNQVQGQESTQDYTGSSILWDCCVTEHHTLGLHASFPLRHLCTPLHAVLAFVHFLIAPLDWVLWGQGLTQGAALYELSIPHSFSQEGRRCTSQRLWKAAVKQHLLDMIALINSQQLWLPAQVLHKIKTDNTEPWVGGVAHRSHP